MTKKEERISKEFHDELVRLFGEEKARSLVEDEKNSPAGLQYMAFKKQFRRNFGINFNVILTTFIIIGVFLLTIELFGL